LVSIITPSFNKDKFISQTIESVLNQTYSNWELIIVDDASTDNTISIINGFKERDNRIKLFINSENKGANYCRNLGIEKSLGEFIVFLDSDDLLTKECLMSRTKMIINKPSLDFAVFTMGVFRQKIGDASSTWYPKRKDPLSDFLKHKLPWQTMQPIWRKTFVESMNGFDVEFQRLQDVEFHTRALLKEGVKFECFNFLPDCYFRIDQSRMNYSNYIFFQKFVNSGIKYYQKFYSSAVERKMERKLMGTLYMILLQILNAYKSKKISKVQFDCLEIELVGLYSTKNITLFQQMCLAIGKKTNLFPINIKGLNWLINKLIVI
jgi:glycosyltransferase involved in cell wall biosynthesis